MPKLSPDLIRKYVQKLRDKGVPSSVIHKKLGSLYFYFNWLSQKKILGEDVIHSLKETIKKISSELREDVDYRDKGTQAQIVVEESKVPRISDFEKATYVGEKKTEGIAGEVHVRFHFQTYKIRSFLVGLLRRIPLLGSGIDRFHPRDGSKAELTSRTSGNFADLTIQHYIGAFILLMFMAALGAGLYNQFFKQTATPFAYPSSLVKGSRTLSFQGRLTDSVKNPITTSTSMVFKLYSHLTSTAPAYLLYTTGTCSIQPDQDGIFNALIGQDCGSEIGSEVFSENANVYLDVTVGSETLTPRQQIANVGYAINSETLQGLPAGTGATTPFIPYVDANGLLDISTANADISLSSGTGPHEIKTGGTSVLALMPGNYSGNLGIGTTSPTEKVDIGGSGSNLTFSDATGPHQIMTGGASNLALMPGGNVGVGTTTPSNDLTIVGNASIGSTSYNIAAPSNGLLVEGNVGIGFTSPASKLAVAGGQSIGTGFSANAAPTNGLIVQGNVGIGSTGRSGVALDVQGQIRVGTTASASSTDICIDANGILSACAASSSVTGDGATNYLARWISSSQISTGVSYDTGTNLGIGTTITNSKLTIAGNAAIGVAYTAVSAPSNGLIVQGNVGIGNTGSSYRLDVSGSIYGTTVVQNGYTVCDQSGNCTGTAVAIGGSGTQNYIPKFYSQYTIGDSILFDGGTNLGISTTIASSKLTVNGNASIGVAYTGVAAPTNGLIVQGNVGIGTTTPSNALNVVGNNTGAVVEIFNINSSGYAGVEMQSAAGGSANWKTFFGYSNANDHFRINARSIPIVFMQDSNEKIRIDTNGNLGIGLSGPTERLQIHGTTTSVARFTTDTTGAANTDGIAVGYDSSSGFGFLWNRENQPIVFATNNAEKMRLDQNGNLGIGTTFGLNKLSVAGNQSIGLAYTGVAAPTNGLLVQGNTGFGTTSPGASLEVGTPITGGSELTQYGVRFNPTLIGSANTNPQTAFYSLYNVPAINIGGSTPQISNVFGQYLGVSLGTGTTISTFYGQYIAAPSGSTASQVTNRYALVTENNAGNIGLGTTSPKNKLDVYGALAVGTSFAGTYTAPSNGIIVQGRTGVGTSNPQGSLHVADTGGGAISNGGRPTFYVQSTSSYGGMSFGAPTGQNVFLEFLQDTTKKGLISYNAGPNTFNITGYNAQRLALGAGASDTSEQISIYSTGNVGIGTTSPTSLLTVSGNGNFTGNLGVGTTSPASTYKLYTAGAIYGTTVSQNGYTVCDQSGNCTGTATAIGGSGTQNYIAKFNSQYVIMDSQLYDDGTDVTIGGTVGTSKLTVAGNASVGVAYTGVNAPTNGLIVQGNAGIGSTGRAGFGLDVSGGLNVGGGATVATSVMSPLFSNTSGYVQFGSSAVGSTVAGSTLYVSPAATLGSSLTVVGNSNLSGTTVSQLHVTGATTLNSTLNVAGVSNLAGTTVTHLYSTGRVYGTTVVQNGNTVCDQSGNCAGTAAGIGGSGTANYVPKFYSQYSIGDSQIFDNGTFVGIGYTAGTNGSLLVSGNVGIGITNPTAKLDIRGTSGAFINPTITNPGSAQVATTNKINAIATSNNANYVIGFQGEIWVDPTNTANWTDTSQGLIGVRGRVETRSGSSGTVSVAKSFVSQIEKGGATITDAYHYYLENAVGSGYTNQYGLYVPNLTSATNDYGIYVAGSDTYAVWVDGGTSRFDGPAYLAADSGNVGIGGTIAASKLTVAGNASIGVTYTGVAAPTNGLLVQGNIGIGNTNPSSSLEVSAIITALQTGTHYGVRLTNALSGTMATTQPQTAFYSLYNVPNILVTGTSPQVVNVFGAYNGISLGTGTTVTNFYGQYIAAPSGSTASQVTNKYALVTEAGAGNVGIGLTNPAFRLDVNGGVNVGAGLTVATGNIVLPNSNTISGVSNFVQFNNGISVGGGTTYFINSSGQANLAGSTIAQIHDTGGLTVLGNSNLSGTTASQLHVTGATTLNSTLNVTGISNLAGTTVSQLSSTGRISGTTIIQNTYTVCDQSGNCAGTAAGIGGSGVANYISKFIDTYTIANSQLYDDGTSVGIGYSTLNSAGKFVVNGNVGIGITNPATLLDVAGTGRIRIRGGTATGPSTGKGVEFGMDSNDLGFFISYDRDGSAWEDFSLQSLTMRFHTNGSETMRIDTNGNVGIGTTFGINKLAVSGNQSIGSAYTGVAAPTNGLIVQGNVGIGSTGRAGFTLDVGGLANLSGTTVSQIHSTGAISGATTLTISGLSSLAGATATQIHDTGGLSVLGNSNLSGTTVSQLHNTGGLSVLGNSNLAGTTVTQLYSTGQIRGTTVIQNGYTVCDQSGNCTGTATAIGGSGTQNYIAKFNSQYVIMDSQLYDDGTDVTIGGTVGTSKLTVAGNASIGVAYTGVAAPTNGLIVQGNVGIGTTDPGFKLDVINEGAQLRAFAPAGGYATMEFRSGSKLWQFSQRDSDNYLAFWEDGTNPRLVMLEGGNVGIGTTTVASKLAVGGNQSIGVAYTGVAAPTNGLLVQGNSGFGTTSPSASLEVGSVITGGSELTQYGVRFNPTLIGSANTNPQTAFYSLYNVPSINIGGSTPQISNVYGQYLGVSLGTGTTISTFYGQYIAAPSGSTASQVTNKYALVTEQLAGNVGFGTTGPNYKLEVNGSIYGTGITATQTVMSPLFGNTSGYVQFGTSGVGTTISGSTLSIVPDTTLAGKLTVVGVSNLAGTTVSQLYDSGTLQVAGLSNLSGTTATQFHSSGAISGATTLTISGLSSLAGATATQIHDTGALTVLGNSNLSGTTASQLHVTGATTLNSTLNVTGVSNLAGTTISQAHITGGLSVLGNSNLAGSTASQLHVSGGLSVLGNANLAGTTVSQLYSTGQVRVGSTAAASSTDVCIDGNGVLAACSNGAGGVGGNGALNYVARWIGATTISTGVSYDNGSAFGIGTTIVTNTLNVSGNQSIGSAYTGVAAPTNGLIVQGNVGVGSTGRAGFVLDVGGLANLSGTTVSQIHSTGAISGATTLTISGLSSLAGATATQIHDTGALTVLGNTNLAGTTVSQLYDSGTLQVAGLSNLSGTTATQFHASGAISGASTLTISGISNLQGTTATQIHDTGALTVLGISNLAGTTVSQLHDTGTLTVLGNTNLVGTTITQLNVTGSIFNSGGVLTLADDTNIGSSALYIINSGNIAVGGTIASSKLTIAGNASIGLAYTGVAAPTNGLLVQGNAGFGTTSPGASLEVGSVITGGSELTQYAVRFNPTLTGTTTSNPQTAFYSLYNVPSITIGSSTPQLTNLYVNYNGVSLGTGTTISNYFGQYIAAPSGSTASQVTNRYALVTEANAGNVGIGKTYTESGVKLDVEGQVRVGSTAAAGGSVLCRDSNGILSACPGGGAPTGNGALNYLARWISSSQLSTGVSYDNGSFLGVGYTAASSGSLLVSGNVGIGTTDPKYKLEVNGSIYGTGITATQTVMSPVFGNTSGSVSFGTSGVGTTITGSALSVVPDTTLAGKLTVVGVSNLAGTTVSQLYDSGTLQVVGLSNLSGTTALTRSSGSLKTCRRCLKPMI